MLVTLQAGIMLLQFAVFLPAREVPAAALVPLVATGAATLLLLRPPRSARGSLRLMASWFLLDVLGILGTLAVARAGTPLMLGALLTIALCAGMRHLGFALAGAAMISVAVFLMVPPPDPVGAFAPHALTALAGLLSAYAVEQVETDRRSLESTLADQQPLVQIGRFAQGLAHEFHNVLGGVQGLLDFASRSNDPAEVREALDVSARSLARAVHIVENLKTYTREAPLQRVPCDLRQVVDDSLALVAHECRKAKIEVRVDGGPAPVVADPARLQQVFLNIELNAVRAMPSGGTLTVRLDGTRVRFTDTGAGIPEADLPHLFKPRFTTRAESNGLGLGLFVSERIVRAHGGEILVDGGPGATFTVVLP